MFTEITEHVTHAEVGHLGFTLDVETADGLYDPPVPSTAVNLYGPYDTVTAAAMILDGTANLVIVDILTPHPCSLSHGCVHAGLVLDGHVDHQIVRDAIVAVFGPPRPADHLPVAQHTNPLLN